jgi:uncharacterized protein (TIGR02246 family)
MTRFRTLLVLLASAFFSIAGCNKEIVKPAASEAHATSCHPVNEQDVVKLFDRWNDALKSGDPHKVVANYAAHSILLPTLSNKPRVTVAEKLDYFEHFLEKKPSGKIDFRFFVPGCNSAVDSGLYTFTLGATGETVHARYTFTYAWDGRQWLITSHHSSLMPEDK